MGFGYLLIGYIFAFIATIGLGPYLFAGLLVGGFMMYLGLSELKKYSPVFIYALIGSILIILCSFYETAAWIDSNFLLNIGIGADPILKVFDWIEFVLNLLFNLTLLYGIADLSRRVDYSVTREKAFRNMFIVGLFNAYQVLMFFPIAFIESDKPFFMTILVILQVIYTVLNAFLIFKCYAMICPEGQEDMPRKKSRFAFVNKFREVKDAKEEKVVEEMKKYYEDKLKKKNEKKQIQHSSKKHKKKK
ncbi:MAG: hypothetical protein IJY39_03870 [Clostridia bacterium]|nr:hypothetical protein [Clostridia bacterium]